MNNPLDPDDFSDFVQTRFKRFPTKIESVLHAAVGISGEAGELLDAVKKAWAYSAPLDMANVIEELGDLEFYLCAMRQELQILRKQVILENMAKLIRRYPDGYTDSAAIERADKKE